MMNFFTSVDICLAKLVSVVKIAKVSRDPLRLIICIQPFQPYFELSIRPGIRVHCRGMCLDLSQTYYSVQTEKLGLLVSASHKT